MKFLVLTLALLLSSLSFGASPIDVTIKTAFKLNPFQSETITIDSDARSWRESPWSAVVAVYSNDTQPVKALTRVGTGFIVGKYFDKETGEGGVLVLTDNHVLTTVFTANPKALTVKFFANSENKKVIAIKRARMAGIAALSDQALRRSRFNR
jgi:hypothetical protein